MFWLTRKQPFFTFVSLSNSHHFSPQSLDSLVLISKFLHYILNVINSYMYNSYKYSLVSLQTQLFEPAKKKRVALRPLTLANFLLTVITEP